MTKTAPAPRLDTSVSDGPTIEQAQRLMAHLGLGNADLYRTAVELLNWCVGEVGAGRRIASVDQEGRSVREIAMPALNASRVQRRLTVSEEGMQQITRLLAEPPEPTPALRELMERTRQMRAAPAGA